ncbi:hypothetical protein ACJJTC_002673 [Scirpophaga incertulas]
MSDNSRCRTCLSPENLQPIFACEDPATRSSDLLLVTGVKIEPNDGLTQAMCKSCNNVVANSLKLRAQSIQSEKILIQSTVIHTNSQKKLLKPPKKTVRRKKKVKVENKTSTENGGDDTNADDATTDGDDSKKVKKEKEEGKVPKRKRLTKVDLQKYLALAIAPDKPGPMQCRLCHKILKERRFFINHAKTHFEAENECEFCGKKFVNRNSMRNHQQRLHGATRKHACRLCPYRAVDTPQLLNHERTVHTGCRPYSCHVCGQTFTVRAAVAQHMRRHFAKYTVQCERCPALFRSRSELASHRNKVHIMSYTYCCYMCPNKYKASMTVKKHLVKIHGVPFDKQLPIQCIKLKRED